VATVRERWQPSVIRRVTKSFDTGTEVVLVETDKGRGYLKALGNRAGPHALACEWVGTNLAKFLGLSTFEFALTDVSQNDEIPLFSGRLALPGPAFITRAEKGITWGGKESELKKLANPKDIGRLVLFDTWTLNCDRHPPDPNTRKPNWDNVFFSREGAPRSQFLIKAIDHTHCFTCGRELTPRLAQIDQVRTEGTYGLFPEFEQFLHRNDMRRAVADLQAIRRSQVEEVVEAIPGEWQVEQPVREALINFICDRAIYLSANFVGNIWPQGELEV
jgi:hypothetical protein